MRIAGAAFGLHDPHTPIQRGVCPTLTRVIIMKLRFAADRRTLLWSFVLFPALPVVSYAIPAIAPWLVPFGLYLAYCAGVLTHNHVHSPTFRGKRANALYGVWLSFFYGSPIFVWVPTHNQNHHRYLDGPGDFARIATLAPNNTLHAALCYPTRSAIAQLSAIWRYVTDCARHHPRRFRQILAQTLGVVLGHAFAVGLAIWWRGFAQGALIYGCAILLPALFASWSMMFTNYMQHVGCDPASPDNHSRNFVSPALNWLVFEAGYHTVHHEHPGTHWSAYPALHAERSSRIDSRLNEHSIFGYCLKTYVLTGGVNDQSKPEVVPRKISTKVPA
jgi:beta-carotene hydroxylase